MVQIESIGDYALTYDDAENNARAGVTYLDDTLSRDESRVFFDAARSNGSAQFEDRDGRNFTIIYQNGAYTLISRT